MIEIYDPFTGYFQEMKIDLGDMNQAIARKFNFIIHFQEKKEK